METYQNYKGYGIRYYTFRGQTDVEYLGFVIKSFIGYGEMKGFELATKYIDDLIK